MTFVEFSVALKQDLGSLVPLWIASQHPIPTGKRLSLMEGVLASRTDTFIVTYNLSSVSGLTKTKSQILCLLGFNKLLIFPQSGKAHAQNIPNPKVKIQIFQPGL